MIRRVYQTVRSTEKKEDIIKNAPFWCQDKPGRLKEWLGDGYYFWETFASLAHWWGRVHYLHFGLNYAICTTIFECPDEEILDLVSNTEQMLDIQDIVNKMRQIPEYQDTTFTAQFVINLIRKKYPIKFKALRARGEDCVNNCDDINRYQYYFNRRSSMHMCPEIQICVIDKSTLKLPMELIYCSNPTDEDRLTV